MVGKFPDLSIEEIALSTILEIINVSIFYLRKLFAKIIENKLSFSNSTPFVSSASAPSSNTAMPSPAPIGDPAPVVDPVTDLSIVAAAKSKKSSWVWIFFSSTSSNPTCDVCKKIINHGKSKSTSALLNYFLYKHRDVYDEYTAVEAVKKRKDVGSLTSFIVYGDNFMKEYIRWLI